MWRGKEKRTFQPPLFRTIVRNGVSYFLAIQNAELGTPNRKLPSPTTFTTIFSSSPLSSVVRACSRSERTAPMEAPNAHPKLLPPEVKKEAGLSGFKHSHTAG